MNYANQHVRFERRGDRVQPVRVRKEWVALPSGKRKYITVRVTEVGFGRPEEAPEPWSSAPAPEETTRNSLLKQGLIRELGHGEKFLPLGDPTGWMASVANGPTPWTDPYEIGTDH